MQTASEKQIVKSIVMILKLDNNLKCTWIVPTEKFMLGQFYYTADNFTSFQYFPIQEVTLIYKVRNLYQ